MSLNARQRIDFTVDTGTFEEMDAMLASENPLEMPGYEEKLNSLYEAGLTEAIITGIGDISDDRFAIAAMDSSFLMGSIARLLARRL